MMASVASRRPAGIFISVDVAWLMIIQPPGVLLSFRQGETHRSSDDGSRDIARHILLCWFVELICDIMDWQWQLMSVIMSHEGGGCQPT